MELRDELRTRYEATVRAELAVPGTRKPPPGWPGLKLPPALRESIVAAAELADPAALVDFYAERMPRLAVDQLLRGDDPARRLLWMPIDASRTPRLRSAVDGVRRAVESEDLDADELLGRRDLLAGQPSAAQLAAGTLLGSGLPLVGAYPAEREVIARDLARGDAHAVLDLRLSGHLVHEICHGAARECSGPTAPWLLLEAAATHLGASAFPRHVHPEVPGEAVPGVALFVLVGEALARFFGRRALWQLAVGAHPIERTFGQRAGAALATAGWQDWLQRREPPFARDAAAAVAWVKLADAARGRSPLDVLIDRAAARGPLAAARELPELLGAAGAIPWSELPWWHAEPDAADLAMARSAVRAMYQVDVLAESFQTHPLRPAALHLDAHACLLTRDRVPHGAGPGEPAHWIVPPPICRHLAARGVRRLSVAGTGRSELLALFEGA